MYSWIQSMLLPYHTMLKSKQTHARLGTLTSILCHELNEVHLLLQYLNYLKASLTLCTLLSVLKPNSSLVAHRHFWSSVSTWNEQPADENILLQWKLTGDGKGVGEGSVGWGNQLNKRGGKTKQKNGNISRS